MCSFFGPLGMLLEDNRQTETDQSV